MSERETPLDRLRTLGLELPSVASPVGSYVPAVRAGDLVMTSGQLPLRDGALTHTGLVGSDVTPEEAQEAARLCALNALAAVDALIGIDAVWSVVKVTGYVASAPGFTGQPAVLNGASDLLADVFGERGRHARAAVGVAALPLGAPVEVDLVVEVAAATV